MSSAASAAGPLASIFSLIPQHWVSSFLSRASQTEGDKALGEADAQRYLAKGLTSEALANDVNVYLQLPGLVPGTKQEPHTSQGNSQRGPRSLFRNVQTQGRLSPSLLVLHAPLLALELVLTLAFTAARLVSPVALRAYLVWLTNESTKPAWQGYLIGLGIAACGMALALLNNGTMSIGTTLAFKARQQVSAAVHAKLLRLNGAAVNAISPGLVINLVSDDVRRFDNAYIYWPYAVTAPIELGMVLLVLSLDLDFLSAFVGIMTQLLLIPITGILLGPVARRREATAVATDARVRLSSEVIQGALAFKVLGLEESLAGELHALRHTEAAQLAGMARIKALILTLQFITRSFASFGTFAVYYARHGSFDVPTVMYALALLQLPRRSIWGLAAALQGFAESKVSLGRLQTFLSTPEPPAPTMQPSHTPPSPSDTATCKPPHQQPGDGLTPGTEDGHAKDSHEDTTVSVALSQPGTVLMAGGHYDWSRPTGHTAPAPEKADVSDTSGSEKVVQTDTSKGATDVPGSGHGTLSGVCFALRPGELLGVCGEVGAGKTSLLSVLLGELQPADGTRSDALGSAAVRDTWEAEALTHAGKAKLGPVLKVGRLSYCAQVAWLVSGTVRDNILFGTPYDAAWYDRVVRACALTEDFASFPAGDATELGERGINLSGGQKARMALARATYQHPDVALLDDPLSAVDPKVADTLFQDCIGPQGLLKSCTRILVTHQRQFLPLCDRVLVVRAGRPVALAPWPTLANMKIPELTTMHQTTAPTTTDSEVLAVDSTEVCVNPQSPNQKPPVTPPRLLFLPEYAKHSSYRDRSDPGIPIIARMPLDRSVSLPGVQIMLSPGTAKGLASARQNGRQAFSHGGFVSARFPAHSRRYSPAQLSGRLFTSPRHVPQTPAAAGAAAAAIAAAEDRAAALRVTDNGSKSRRLTFAGMDTVSDLPDARVESVVTTDAGLANAGQLVDEETRASGAVKWHVYGDLVRQVGVGTVLLLAVGAMLSQAAYLAADWWLALWSRASPADQDDPRWLWVYGLILGFVLVFGVISTVSMFAAFVVAATRIHDEMASHLVGAPLSFFHTNPTGRILNRLSKDLSTVDDQLSNGIIFTIQCVFIILGTLVLICVALPYLIPVFVPLGVVFYLVRRRYVAGSRECRRWEAVTRSPLYASVSENIKGLTTIRALGEQDRFQTAFLDKLNTNGAWSYMLVATELWLNLRLELVAVAALLGATLIAAAVRGKISAALLGLALTYWQVITFYIQSAVKFSAEVENNMTCVERMIEYTHLPREAPTVAQGGGEPPEGWPSSGALVWESVCARYRPELPPVLQDVSFSLQPGTVCGIVGRTGSGKSSLALTLFRLIEVTSGRVMLDGVDVSTIGIDALRRQLASITQDPVLFSGTFRSNLDPWGKHDDNELWNVLNKVQMHKTVVALGGLTAQITDAGDNLSQGQRQLLCLARALLQDARVVVLDEATASVDTDTDTLIRGALDTHVRPNSSQPALPSQTKGPFVSPADEHGSPVKALARASKTAGGRVLLVIAHRVDTIMDADHLLVLSGGRLIEQGSPRDLSVKAGGAFNGMVTAARQARAEA